MLAALTALPAVLRLLGRRIDRGRVPFRRRADAVEDGHGAWARIATFVMRRPVSVLVVVTVGLVALASPFLGVKWGSVDHKILPPDSESYVAAEKLATDFGPATASAQLLLDYYGEPGQLGTALAQRDILLQQQDGYWTMRGRQP